MQINLTTDYAVRAVIHLAAATDREWVPGTEIARAHSIPTIYVAKVLQTLSRAGLVRTSPGRSGGAKLLKSPKDVSVLDVIEAMEGPIALNRCLIRKSECPRDSFCPVHTVWAGVQEKMVRQLKAATMAQFIKKLNGRGGAKKRGG